MAKYALYKDDGSGPVEIKPLAGTLRGELTLNACTTLEFDILLRDMTGPIEVGTEIYLYDGSSPDAIFGGTVTESQDEDLTLGVLPARGIHYTCTCFNELADRFHVAEAYEEDLAGDIVRDIVSSFMPGTGVTTGGVADGEPVAKVVFNYQLASTCFNELSELIGYVWRIGADKDLFFADRTTYTAPFSIAPGNRPYLSFAVTRGKGQYRNRQLVRAGKDKTDERTESFVGDGTRQVFTVAYPVAEVPTITVDGAAQTVGILGLEQGKDWYWNKERTEITQDAGAAALTSGDELAVTYRGLFPIIVTAQHDSEVDAQGIHESVLDDPNIDSSDAALEKAQGLLRRYASIDKQVTYTTRRTGLLPGQLQQITAEQHGIDGEFLIDQVSFYDDEMQQLVYSVRGLSGEQVGGWVQFFRKMLGADRKYVIRENEVLVAARSFSDVLSIGDELVVEEHNPATDFVVGTALVGYSEVL